MSFDHGPITYKICQLIGDFPEDFLAGFAENTACPLDKISDEPNWGWVSGRHLLETRIDEETCMLGNYYHLCLRQAERKIPNALLNAECKIAELAQMAAEGKQGLNRKERKDIKDNIKEHLLPTMPPQLSGISVCVAPSDHLAYVSATSQRQMDLFVDFFRKATNMEVVPITPESLAVDIMGEQADGIGAINISPDLPDSSPSGTIGENFLTWLWYFQEQHGGMLPPSKLGEFGLILDGPLVTVADGGGALESTIKKGTPTVSAEAKAALLVGKKLRRVKLILARGKGEEWSVTVDGSDFAFRGLKVPEGDAKLDPISIFDERMTNVFIFNNVFRALYQLFLKEMSDPTKVAEYQRQAKDWVKNRRSE